MAESRSTTRVTSTLWLIGYSLARSCTLGHMRVALHHKKCSFQLVDFARPPCSVFCQKKWERMILLILHRQQFALLVTKSHES